MATQTTTEVTSVSQSEPIQPSTSVESDRPSHKAADIQPLEIEESPAEADQSELDYPRGPQFWLIFASLSLVLTLGGMDANIVATAVPLVKSLKINLVIR